MNFENGMYIKAEIRAIKFRDVVNRSTGEVYHFCSIIVEESAERDKREINLPKTLIQSGMVEELQKLVGKICLIPFYFTFRDNFLNLHYAGKSLPQVLTPKQPQAGAA